MNEPVTDGSPSLEGRRQTEARLCVGCRQTDNRDALLRFVSNGEPAMFAPDIRRRAPGRGVSVHPRYRCVEAAVRTGAFRRALEVDATPSARELATSAAAQYVRRAEGLLLAARRSRHLALGTEAVRDAIAARSVQLLLVANDAEGSREELTEAATRLGRTCLVWSNKQELGRLCGRALLSIVAVLDAGIAHELWHVVRCAAELAEDA
jgi:predicted RNA-binding protein YlxR (DUF448 family)/ribosomal protein L30E